MILLSLIFIGCGAPAKFVNVNFINSEQCDELSNNVDYKYLVQKSEARFIDNLLEKLDLGSDALSFLSAKDKIIVKSIERDFHSDIDAQVNVERVLQQKLLQGGFCVLERDENIMSSLIYENSNNLNKTANKVLVKGKDTLYVGYEIPINYATKILSYRVLNLGLIKVSGKDKTTRFGNAQIEIKVIDAKTSQILLNKILNAFHEDKLNNIESENIYKIKFNNFRFDSYPFINNSKSDNTIPINEKEKIYDTIELIFLKGDDPSTVKIISEKTNITVESFNLPQLGSFETNKNFKYTLKNNKLHPDKYNIYIDNLWAGSFTIN